MPVNQFQLLDQSDKHVRRSGDDYARQFLALLPKGQAWLRKYGSDFVDGCYGLMQYWGFVDARAADLLEQESDPRKTIELLRDWEIAWGLPDPCLQEPTSIDTRRTILLQRMTLLGAQSRAWFAEVAASLGYTIAIGEYSPWICGISRCGNTPVHPYVLSDPTLSLDPDVLFDIQEAGQLSMPRWQIAPATIRFYWKIYVDQARLTWFRCGVGQCGVDPMLIIGLATDLECLIGRWAPAHTKIIYDYTNLSTGGSMAGTP